MEGSSAPLLAASSMKSERQSACHQHAIIGFRESQALFQENKYYIFIKILFHKIKLFILEVADKHPVRWQSNQI